MSTIVVTHTDDSQLTLHTCGPCGSHVWEREGVALDRDAVLGVVRERIADGVPRKVPAPRTRRLTMPLRVEVEPQALEPSAESRTQEMRALLAGFTVQGQSR